MNKEIVLPSNIQVLVADDMMTMRKLIRKELNKMGLHKVVEAEDGQSAWNKIIVALDSGTPFELMLLDWKMPKRLGIDILRKIRSYEKMKYVPVLIMTAEAEKQDVINAIHTGVSGVVLKPFTANILRQKIFSAWETYESKRAA